MKIQKNVVKIDKSRFQVRFLSRQTRSPACHKNADLAARKASWEQK